MRSGLTVAVCCYNSRERIEDTLVRLSGQVVKGTFPIEILVIDNGSTDGTGAAAMECWGQLGSLFPFRVIPEHKAGLSNARRTAVFAANYPYLLFCDDDNLLQEDYFQHAHDLIAADPTMGVLGGYGIPELTIEPPNWFAYYQGTYATGPQKDPGLNGKHLRCLYGAGMVIRTAVLKKLYMTSHESLLTGRTGDSLTSGEDSEICIWFLLMGFRLHYNENLRFYHCIPSGRLTSSYLIRRAQEKGKTEAIFSMYHAKVMDRPVKWVRSRLLWYTEILKRLIHLLLLQLKPKTLDSELKKEFLRSAIRFRLLNFNYLSIVSQKISETDFYAIGRSDMFK